MLAWRTFASLALLASERQNRHDNGSHYEHDTQGDPEPVSGGPDGKDALTKALAARTHLPILICSLRVHSRMLA